MSNWTRIRLTIPAEHRDAANRLAAIIDPDIGGGETFGACAMSPTGENPCTHYHASTLIRPSYVGILTDPASMGPALAALAVEYGRAGPKESDIVVWCDHVQVGDPVGLLPIEPEDDIDAQ